MLSVIKDSNIIADLQKEFEQIMLPFFDEKFTVNLGHQGRDFVDHVWWSNNLQIWMCFKGARGNRYWNGFGITKPQNNSHLSITCEISFPVFGPSRKFQGLFLQEDELENYYIGYRGKISRGRKGIGKELFLKHYRGEIKLVDDNGIQKKVALIGNLYSVDFPIQIKEFVYEVARIKNLV